MYVTYEEYDVVDQKAKSHRNLMMKIIRDNSFPTTDEIIELLSAESRTNQLKNLESILTAYYASDSMEYKNTVNALLNNVLIFIDERMTVQASVMPRFGTEEMNDFLSKLDLLPITLEEIPSLERIKELIVLKNKKDVMFLLWLINKIKKEPALMPEEQNMLAYLEKMANDSYKISDDVKRRGRPRKDLINAKN